VRDDADRAPESRRGDPIDEAFGTGYTKAHPELIAALIQAAAFDRVERVMKDVGDLVRSNGESLERKKPPTTAMCSSRRPAKTGILSGDRPRNG